MQGRYRCLAARCGDIGGLPRFQPEYSQVLEGEDTYPCLLLYLSEDMGLEGIPYQEYQTGCG